MAVYPIGSAKPIGSVKPIAPDLEAPDLDVPDPIAMDSVAAMRGGLPGQVLGAPTSSGKLPLLGAKI